MKFGITKNDVNFIHNSDLFCNHHSNLFISTNDRLSIHAYTVDIFNKKDNLISTFGEFFEREILINNNQKFSEDEITVFSMLNGETKTINKYDIIFKDRFVDSCGMASHIYSQDILEKAFLEFIERQSFIYNYLSKLPGKKIELESLEDTKLNYYNWYILNYVDNINYYNISLINDIFVIIAIGLGRKNRCVGIGTHYNLIKAINNAQKEMLQYFPNCMTKHKHDELGFFLPHHEIIDDEYNSYFNSLSNDELLKCYEYLSNSVEFNYSNNSMEFDLLRVIRNLNKKYEINPYIALFLNQRNMAHLKIIKIIDFNWFPHMFPKLYTNKIYEFVEQVTETTLDRECKILPFA